MGGKEYKYNNWDKWFFLQIKPSLGQQEQNCFIILSVLMHTK